MLKKFLSFSIISLFLVVTFSGCSLQKSDSQKQNEDKSNNKITIITTLFPQYDFTKQIVGDKAEVKLLIPAGVESHSYEPTPTDIININKANLFIYTGKYMEPWAQKIIDGLDNSKIKILDVSRNINLVKTEDIEEHHHNDEESEELETHEHDHEYDPHVWTDPILAKTMVDNIITELCYIDSENANYYKERGSIYKSQLDELNEEFKSIVANSSRKEIIFGGRFAFYYFTQRYGLEYESAYDSCSTETEPSVTQVAQLIKEIKEEKFPVIYHEELIDPKVARSISEETGAKMLLLHSCHNVSKEDFNKGVTYLSLMKQNAENLREGIK